MSWKDYPALSERCYLETLPNGLRLRVVPKPGFAGKFAFLGVNFGSCDTQLPQSGGWPPRRGDERLYRLCHDRLLFHLHRPL